MNDQDKRAVETMVLSGMEKEALYAIFPAFSHETIDEVYESVKAVTEADRGAVDASAERVRIMKSVSRMGERRKQNDWMCKAIRR